MTDPELDELFNTYKLKDRMSATTTSLGLMTRFRFRAAVRDAIANYEKAAPLCEEHRPDGSSRSGCLICGLQAQSRALSAVDYAVGTPNEMGCSIYDADYDEKSVVERVKTKMRVLVDALRVVKSHVEELEDAWVRGALHDRDGQGGLRSNRNVAVRVEVARLISEYDARQQKGPTP